MELLKDRIKREGVNLGKGILKVDSFTTAGGPGAHAGRRRRLQRATLT
jgi:hypothetical protein